MIVAAPSPRIVVCHRSVEIAKRLRTRRRHGSARAGIRCSRRRCAVSLRLEREVVGTPARLRTRRGEMPGERHASAGGASAPESRLPISAIVDDAPPSRPRSSTPRRRARSPGRPRRSSAGAPARLASRLAATPISTTDSSSPSTSTQVLPPAAPATARTLSRLIDTSARMIWVIAWRSVLCPVSPTARARARAAQLAEHLPADPQQQQPAGEQQPDDRQQLQRDGAQGDADHRRADDAEQDGRALLPRRQAGDGQPDDDGVVAGQRDVDQDHLRRARPGPWVSDRSAVHCGSRPLSAAGAAV